MREVLAVVIRAEGESGQVRDEDGVERVIRPPRGDGGSGHTPHQGWSLRRRRFLGSFL
jgi:hypothetical protein